MILQEEIECAFEACWLHTEIWIPTPGLQPLAEWFLPQICLSSEELWQRVSSSGMSDNRSLSRNTICLALPEKSQLESITANYKIHFPSRIWILDWGTEWLWGKNVCHTSVRIRVWISRTYISLDVVVCVSAVSATCQANGRGRQETAQKLMANTHEIHSRIPFWNEKLMFTDKMYSGAW